jgi:hypothetical protein
MFDYLACLLYDEEMETKKAEIIRLRKRLEELQFFCKQCKKDVSTHQRLSSSSCECQLCIPCVVDHCNQMLTSNRGLHCPLCYITFDPTTLKNLGNNILYQEEERQMRDRMFKCQQCSSKSLKDNEVKLGGQR